MSLERRPQAVIRRRPNDWSAFVAPVDNAAATATKAALANNTHYVTSVHAAFNDATIVGLLQIKDGNTVIFNQQVQGKLDLVLQFPLPATEGNAVNAVLAASGTGGKTGCVSFMGFTEQTSD